MKIKTPTMAAMPSAATLSAVILSAGAALAQEADPMIDVNGDGFYSFPELGVSFPDLTAEMFTVMDTTGDGLLDMAEVMAAEEAGMLVMTE